MTPLRREIFKLCHNIVESSRKGVPARCVLKDSPYGEAELLLLLSRDFIRVNKGKRI